MENNIKGQFNKKYKEGDLIRNFLFIREFERENNNRIGLFKCPYCGNEFKDKLHKISSGKKNSCGCRFYINMKRNVIHGHNSNGKPSSEYTSWHSAIQRCENPTCKKYPVYGGAGITFDPRWKDFRVFLADMGPKSTPLHTLDRYPNMAGNYEPGNCRWATRKQQMANTKCTHFVMYQGERLALPDICTKLGFNRKKVTGWKWYKKCSIQEAFEYILKKQGFQIYKPVSNFIPHAFGVVNS